MTAGAAGWVVLAALVPLLAGCSDLLPLRRTVALDSVPPDTVPEPPKPVRRSPPRDTTRPADLAAGLASVRAELRRLVPLEATFFAETGAYTADLDRLRFMPGGEVAIDVVHASNDGWAAVGSAPILGGRTCVIWIGRPAARPATARSRRTGREGVPVCDALPAAARVAAGPSAAGVVAEREDTMSALDEVSPTVLMRVDLRNLVRSQDAYFATQGIYARRTEPLALQFLWHRGVEIRILHADTRSWSAEAVHDGAPGKSCVIWFGAPPERPRTDRQGRQPARSGVPVCDD